MSDKICYLCGKNINPNASCEAERLSGDHVPPLVFYPKVLRKRGLVGNLRKLPTHQGCNAAIREDEEYVARVMGLAVWNKSVTGAALYSDFENQAFKTNKLPKLFQHFWANTSRETPKGISLPHGKQVLRIRADRIRRVIWKITRGIYFLTTGRFLPESARNLMLWVKETKDLAPQLLQVAELLVSAASNPGVLVFHHGSSKESKRHYLMMLFWNSVLFLSFFHETDCDCEECQGIKDGTVSK